MSLYCTLPRGGGSYYHSSIHSGSSFPSSSSSSSSSSPSSSSSSTSTITSDNNSILTQGETIGNNNYHHRHSVNARYQHQSIKTMFNNPYNNSQQATFNENCNSTNLLAHSLINQQQQQQILSKYQQDYQDYQQFQQQQNVLPTIDSSNGKNFSPASSVLPSPQGNQFNGILNSLTNSVNMCNNNIDNNGSIATTNNMNNYNQQTSQQHQSLQLTLPRPEPQRIYYGLDSFDDLKAIRRNSITSLFEQDPSTPNFYGDEDSAYDSTSNESLRLTAKELTKRSNSKKYFTLPTKLGRRLRKASLPEFNHGANSLTPSPVSSDCSPSPKLIFNGPTFPPSNSKSSSSASSSISSSSSVSPPSTSSSSLSSSNVSNVSVSSAPSTSLATEMSAPHNHHVENCAYNNQLINKTTSNDPDNSASPGANENVTCHCCYLLGCHSNQSPSINNTAHYQNNQQYQQQQQQPQQHGRVNSGGVNTGTSANNIVSSTGQQSTLETLWEEPSSGHESVRLTEEAIYAAMRELNISLPSKDAVTGQSVGNRNGNSSSWLRANFLKAFRRSSSSSSSKNRSSKLISSNPSSASSNNNASLSYPEREQPVTTTSTTIRPVSLSGPIGHTGATTMTLNQPCQPYPDVNGGDTISATSGSEISSSKRIISSGPSSASSLSSLPLSCSSVPPTPPLTPLPPYHSQQQQQLQQQPPPPQLHINQNYHHHNQNQHNQNEAQQHEQYLSHTLYASEEDVIKELNRQLAEKDQLLQEVCMESINHLNTIESLKELVTQLKDEIVSLKKQNDQLNHGIQYSINMDKVKSVNQVNNRNCA